MLKKQYVFPFTLYTEHTAIWRSCASELEPFACILCIPKASSGLFQNSNFSLLDDLVVAICDSLMHITHSVPGSWGGRLSAALDSGWSLDHG